MIVQHSPTVESVVNGVVLSECKYVRTRCEVHLLRVPVGPGRRRPILTIETTGGDQGPNFRYRISREATGSTPTLPGQ